VPTQPDRCVCDNGLGTAMRIAMSLVFSNSEHTHGKTITPPNLGAAEVRNDDFSCTL
jgi:hypothetical protein